MSYRSLPDLPPPSEADPETAETAAERAAIERDERHLRILARLTDIAMNLAEKLGRQADAQIDAQATVAASPADPPAPPPAAAAFQKMSQTVRRTLALEARLAAGLKARNDVLFAERAARRTRRDAEHKAAKIEAIQYGVHDAYATATPHDEYVERIENLMGDVREHLEEVDEFRDYLDRPVGETVARFCAALGLDPDLCAMEDGEWRVHRTPTEFEIALPRYRGETPDPLPPAPGVTSTPLAPAWDAAGQPPDI